MTRASSLLAASRAFCRNAARRARSSFYPSFLLLPRSKREAMEALYTYFRHCDDLGDDDAPLAYRRAALAEWRAEVLGALNARPGVPSVGVDPVGRDANTASAAFLAALPALADAVRRFSIPVEYLTDVLDGVEMDLEGRRYEAFDDLAVYCRRVASSVGRACACIWGARDDEAHRAADQCGIAFQLTNIVRDIAEDAARGRLYLPLAEVRECGYTADSFLDLCRSGASAAASSDGRFGLLMAGQIDRARRFYRQGAGLIDLLDADCRAVFGMMVATYGRLLEKLARQPSRVLEGRVRLSRREKLWIGARWLLLPPRRPALP